MSASERGSGESPLTAYGTADLEAVLRQASSWDEAIEQALDSRRLRGEDRMEQLAADLELLRDGAVPFTDDAERAYAHVRQNRRFPMGGLRRRPDQAP